MQSICFSSTILYYNDETVNFKIIDDKVFDLALMSNTHYGNLSLEILTDLGRISTSIGPFSKFLWYVLHSFIFTYFNFLQKKMGATLLLI